MANGRQSEWPELDRRRMVAGAGLLGLSAALTACGAAPPAAPATAPPSRAPSAPAAVPPGSGLIPAGGDVQLAPSSDVPVGGGAVFPEHRVVVTQPSAGRFAAFSAICTHEQCTVSQVANGTINCPCHGSRFAITDGSVVHGPATRPLHARTVTLRDGALVLGE
ncbi:MAG TPA: Rieske (2Fe-2S) protein [Pseudonocardia sp.]|jgi:Rieske Fe-S protein|nr:Rieske (2Fe-2S) protein [Pseudonocardia sp.]